MNNITIKENKFVDSKGKTIQLYGINHVVKEPDSSYVYSKDKELFTSFKQCGFNCIRYGIIWDRLEPTPGQINEDYLRDIDQRVRWAEEAGVYLILDMHQDLFGKKYADGAPDWATLDEELPHQTGHIWSDAYLLSQAIQKSFDNFWANTPASDGIGIQDHYINVWKTVAQRYKDEPAVIGFDIMNEPFMGSGANQVFEGLLESYAKWFQKKNNKTLTKEELLYLWTDENERLKTLNSISKVKDYEEVIDGVQPLIDQFEENELSAFYQRIQTAIRSVNENKILFLEHNYFCNMGIKSSFKIPLNPNGSVDSLCAYAPHGYDLLTDTPNLGSQPNERVSLIFKRIAETGDRLNIPVWVGEWGAFYEGDYTHHIQYILNLFKTYHLSQAYWCWYDGIEKQSFYKDALCRKNE